MSGSHPPRPRVALRVAVAGHRRDRIPRSIDADLEQSIAVVLSQVESAVAAHHTAHRDLYSADPPLLTLLSPLAEGADRCGAEAALRRPAWRLHGVLPFGLATHQQDSAEGDEDSPGRFADLLDRAAAVTVLDGVPGRFDAYVPLGRALVGSADLLIAVWDGQQPRGPGGTAAIVADARRDALPIVRIDPAFPYLPWLEDLALPDCGRSAGLEGLLAEVTRLMDAPGDPTQALRWFAERSPGRRPSRLYERVLALLQVHRGTDGQPQPPVRADLSDPGTTRHQAWIADWYEYDPHRVKMTADRFASQAGWADAMAQWYAAEFRASFTSVYLLAGLIVLAGGLLHLESLISWPPARVALALAEPCLIGLMLWRVRRGRAQGLHERWMDYRSLAERTRHLALLWPLARHTPLMRVPRERVPGDPRAGWVAWLLRATARAAGLVPGHLDGAHAEAARRFVLRVEAAPQRIFHRGRRERLGPLSHPAERLAEGLVVLALALAILHHTGLLWWAVERIPGTGLAAGAVLVVVGALVTALPAIAAAVHGFLGTADLDGIALRSAGIEGRLAELQGQLGRLDPVDLDSVGHLTLEMTRAMEGELGAWHTATASRRLQPG